MFYVFTKKYGIVSIEAERYELYESNYWYFYDPEGKTVASFYYQEVHFILSDEDYQRNTKLRKDEANASSKLLISAIDELLRTIDGNNRTKLCGDKSHCSNSDCGCHVGCEYDSAAYKSGDDQAKS